MTEEEKTPDINRAHITHITVGVAPTGANIVLWHFSTALAGQEWRHPDDKPEAVVDDTHGWDMLDGLPLLDEEHQVKLIASGDSPVEVVAELTKALDLWEAARNITETTGGLEGHFHFIIEAGEAKLTHFVGGNPVFHQRWNLDYKTGVITCRLKLYSALGYERLAILEAVQTMRPFELLTWINPQLRMFDPALSVGDAQSFPQAPGQN